MAGPNQRLVRYPLQLGRGISLNESDAAQVPAPTRLAGLVPRGASGRLYAYGDVGSPSLPPLVTSPTVAPFGFDHAGMFAAVATDGTLTRWLVPRHGSRTSMTWPLVNAQYRPTFYEGAGFFSGAVQPGTFPPTDGVLNGPAWMLESTDTGGVLTSDSASWSLSVTAHNVSGGQLSPEAVGMESGSRKFTVIVVRCIRTHTGLFGVAVGARDVTTDHGSSHAGIRVSITNTDGKRCTYAVYVGEFIGEGEIPRFRRIPAWWLPEPIPEYDPDGGRTLEQVVLHDLVEATTNGSVTHDIASLPLGETLPDGPSGNLMVAGWGDGEGNAVVAHQGRLYGVSMGQAGQPAWGAVVGMPAMRPVASGQKARQPGMRALPPQQAVVYSAGLSVVNMASELGYFTPNLHNSQRITALTSSPAGLLIFGDNETLVARGDPMSQEFSVQVLSGSVGCDYGAKPAVLGGVVFTVHKGRIWAINLGSGVEGVRDLISGLSDELTTPVRFEELGFAAGYLERGDFARVYADVENMQLVAAAHWWGTSNLTPPQRESYKLFRYDLQSGQWLEDFHPGTPQDHGDDVLLGPTTNGLHYWRNPGFTALDTAIAGNYSEAVLGFEGLTLGDEGTRKLFRRINVYAQGFDVDSDQEFFPHPVKPIPEIAWRVYGAAGILQSLSGVMVGEQVEPNHWVFTFPSGVVGNRLDFTLTGSLRAASGDKTAYLDSPVVIEYLPRYQRAWRGERGA